MDIPTPVTSFSSSPDFRSVCCLMRKPMWLPDFNPIADAPYAEVLLFSALYDPPIFHLSYASSSSFSLFFRKIPYIWLNFLWELSQPSRVVPVYSPLPSPSKFQRLQYIPKKQLCLDSTPVSVILSSPFWCQTHDTPHWTEFNLCVIKIIPQLKTCH